MAKKILLVGPMPPAVGGVSSHVSRLYSKINSSSDFECAVIDLGRFNYFNSKNKKSTIFSGLIYFLSSSIVHIHISHSKKLFIARFSKFLGKKVVYTQHNNREDQVESNLMIRKFSDFTIKVYRSPFELDSDKTIVIPAYIKSDSNSELPFEIKSKLADYKKIVAALCTHPKDRIIEIDGKDIYGFDILLKAYSEFATENTLLLLLDANGTMRHVYRSDMEILKKNGFNILYLTEVVDFTALLSAIDLYIRPTRSDGDSIAIREALDAGVMVLASDCVNRPGGVHVFQNENVDSLSFQASELLKQPKQVVIPQRDFSQEIIAIYHSL